MASQSVANNPNAPAQSQIPAIRSFQFDNKAIGDIKKGVNYFRGNVQLPVEFLLLTGREGLDVKVSAMYSSNIRSQVKTWNSEAPTGILGLGWEMPLEHIAVYKSGSGSSTSDKYFLVSSGSANPLVRTKDLGNGIWLFQSRNYEFWDIQYDTNDESWRITKEDGFVHTYGGKNNAGHTLQFGVKWGNWIGSSSQLAGQEQYCVAWNLASVESTWGQRVTYAYHNVDLEVGSGGKKFTQASYVKTVVDSVGRSITFNFGEKYGARNPGEKDRNPIIEYQAENAGQPEPNAYQDKYETLFLDSVDVRNADDEELYRLQFAYDFINMAISSDPSFPLLWKRCLKTVYQYAPSGATLPGMQFEYASQDETNPGALKAVTYPSGGVARMVYKKVLIDAPKRITVQNPLPQSTPGVWHGDNYVVFTFCRPNNAGVSVLIRSWDGRWVETDFDLPSTQADPKSIRVIAESDFFALSFRNTNLSRDELYIYQRESKRFGEWTLYNNQPYSLFVKPDAGPSSFVAGSDFVIACNKDYVDGTIQGFSYAWQSEQWMPPSVMPEIGGDGVVVAAALNFYIVVCYFRDLRQAKFQILYRNLNKDWQAGPVATAGDFPVMESKGQLLLSVTPGASYFAATHITSSDNSKVAYRVDIFDWNEAFQVLNVSNPAQAKLETPLVGNQPVYEVFRTITAGPFVNNNIANLRNVGGFSASSGGNWLNRDFIKSSSPSNAKSAAAEDVALLCETSAGRQINQLLTFNPNFPSDSGWSFPNFTNDGSYPTVSGNILTVGKNIYGRNFKGEWLPLQTQLFGLTAEETVQNRAPNYIAYQDTDGPAAKSYFVGIKNGQASTPTELPGGAAKIYVSSKESCSGAGTNLAGPRFLVSYSSSSSFCSADQLFLQNLDEGNITDVAYDYPIGYIEIEDACSPNQSFKQSYFYANSSESQIAYNAVTGVSQYPLVYEVAGVASLDNLIPSRQPYGRSERYFSNGLSPQARVYPSAWPYNYQNILNGMLLAQKDFDSDNRLVSSQINYWEVFKDDPVGDGKLYGGYARLVRSTSMNNGVATDSVITFEPTTGLETQRDQQYYDSDGISRMQRSEKRYACQVPEYKPAFLKQHNYSTVVQETQSVSGRDAGAWNYVKCEVTTFRNWAEDQPGIQCAGNNGAKCQLAPWQKYAWTTPGKVAPEFDFSFGGQRPGWLLVSKVMARSKTEGVITEQRDVNGVPSSWLYDNRQRYKIADFPNGSLQGDEVSYWGFEAYEEGLGWNLGSGASIVPDSGDDIVDVHTGLRSLRLAASTTGTAGISRTFRPARQGMPYVFSAWVKKPASFNNSNGNGRLQISVAGGKSVTIEFPDKIGEWVYVSQEFDVPVGSAGVEILGQNLNTGSHVLVDDIRFSPFSCLFEGTGYDTLSWLPNAGMGANGESDRTVYDTMQQRVVRTNGADSVTEILSSYFSRSGHQGTFSPVDPNRDAKIRPAEGGVLCTFTRGSEWQQLWHSPPDVWQVEGTVLTQKSPALAGTLSINDPQYGSDYVLEVGLETRESVLNPVGIRFGRNLIVQWNPTSLAWELFNGPTVVATSNSILFSIPTTPFADSLSNGDISTALHNLFDNAGYPLPADSTVTPGTTANKSWVLTSPANRFRYDLLEEGEKITVHRVAGDWLAIVADRALVFCVQGQQIFSYESPAAIVDAAPELFFGNRVAISRLAIGRRPHVEISYRDSRSNEIQLQALADNCAVVSQTIPDSMGRAAVRTKSAYVAPEVSPLLAYCPQFARIDWVTGKMTGLVADAYPEDGGYPYSRETYEQSPLERVVEQGVPGEPFRIGAYSTRIEYTNEGGKFHKTITTNPNNDVFFELRNDIDQVVSLVSVGEEFNLQNQTIYDDAGNPWQRRSPNYFRPPTGSTADDWVDSQLFDYAGRVTSSWPGRQARTQFIYDRAGNLRFMQDPQGAESGNFNYVKYNLGGRQLETGYIAGAWNAVQLQIYADTDPAWPPTPPTWRKQYTYNGSQEIQLAIGRVTEVKVNNTDNGAADVIEQFRYDILGNTTIRTLIADDYEAGLEHRVDYAYNNLSAVIQTTYPATTDAQRLNIYHRNNRLNQLIAISETADFSNPLAAFSYRANGQPLEQTLSLSDQKVISTFDFNSPLWLESIRQENSTGETLFGESLTYTEGGFVKPGQDGKYYDGSIASATSHGSTDDQYRYGYSGIGAIETAGNEQHPDRNLGVAKSVAYDANGNFDSLTSGDTEKKFDYFNGTQRVRSVRDAVGGSVLAGFEYNQNGNATKAKAEQSGLSKAHDLSFTYDPATKMTTQVVDSVAGGNTLSFRYGHDNNRVLKNVWLGPDLVEKKLYIRGLNSLPLCELTTGGAATPVIYIYGPAGLLVMRRGNATYGVLKDHLGSTRAVVDSKARVVAKYDYLTFGSLSACEELSPGFLPYLFTGQEFDREIGLYNYRTRFYSAELGRFLAVDSQAQFFSPYLYASNNPVLFIDPTGGIATWARVLFGVAMAVVGVAVIGLTIATGGATAPLVAGWATAAGASAGVAAGVGAAAAVVSAAALGAASGAALGSSFYALGTSNEDFSWSRLGQQAALGAIAGAITGGVVQGLSIGGQAIATAATGIGEAGAKWAASVTAKAFLSYAGRQALVGGISSAIGGATASGVSGAVSNIWGLTNLGPGEMALSIFSGLGAGAVKGAGGGIGGAAFSARIKAPAMGLWNSASSSQQTAVKVVGAIGGVAVVGGAYGYLYNRETAKENA